MNTLNRYFSEETFHQLQAGQFIRVFDPGVLDIEAYQWLLSQAVHQVAVQLVVRQGNAQLTPSYIARFNETGSLLLQLPETARWSAPAFLFTDQLLLTADANTGRRTGSLFKQETNSTVIARYAAVFDQLLEIGRLTTSGLAPATPQSSAEKPSDERNEGSVSPIRITFQAHPQKVDIHRRFELSWNVRGAQHIQIEPLIGSAPPQGARLLTLEKTTVFTLTASKGDIRQSAVTKVEVSTAPKIEYFLRIINPSGARETTLTANPELPNHFAVVKGQVVELSWQAYHCDVLKLDGQEVALAGSQILHPEGSLMRRFQASGDGRELETTVVLEVFARPEITHLQAPENTPISIHTSFDLPEAHPPLPPNRMPAFEQTAQAATYDWPERPSLAQRVRLFGWFCAGVNRDIMRACPPTESVKYAGIGMAVFFTGLLAAISGGYALYTAFDSVIAAVCFGMLWGALIFNIDRLVVASMKKEGSGARQWRMAIPRFLLAIILSIVIAKPLELRVFKPEIDALLAAENFQKRQKIGALFEAKLAGMEQQISQVKAETDRSFSIRENLYQEYRCECDGTCGTGKVGRGSECERKEQKYQQADREYQALKFENDRLIEQLRSGQAATSELKQQELDKLAGARTDGLLARLNASGNLPFLPGFFIMLLILVVEIAPVLSKLLTPRGVYDHAVRLAEEQYVLEQEARFQLAQQAAQQQSSLQVQLTQAELDRQVDQKAAVLRLIADAQLQLVKDQVDDWLKKEREKRSQG